jgi:hypothetical protein
MLDLGVCSKSLSLVSFSFLLEHFLPPAVPSDVFKAGSERVRENCALRDNKRKKVSAAVLSIDVAIHNRVFAFLGRLQKTFFVL